MADYRKMYTVLFNAASDAVKLLEENEVMLARNTLINAQRKTEELYMDADEVPLTIHRPKKDGEDGQRS